MDLSVKEHLRRLEERLQVLNRQIMENRGRDERNQLEAEIRAANLAIAHYRAAVELERSLNTSPG
jgi:hypothetical protein